MTAKRAVLTDGSSDLRRGHDSAARKARRRKADVAPTPRPVERTTRPTSTSQAKARAKARKAKAPKVIRPALRDRLLARLVAIDLRPRTLAAKVPFVVLVIGSLGVGLGLTLWLSTDSAERTYQLGSVREQNRLLQQQAEALERDVRQAQSAPALAEAARSQGMIPTRDTAHLVQGPDGNWVVVGTPKPADGVPPPPLNIKLPDANPAPAPPPPPSPLPPASSLEVPVLVPRIPGGQVAGPAPGLVLAPVPAVVPTAPGAGPANLPATAEQFSPITGAIPGGAR